MHRFRAPGGKHARGCGDRVIEARPDYPCDVTASSDAYKTLGINPSASDAEVRAAYRRLVKLHHPDHNAGSLESTRRFEEIQEAYAAVLQQRTNRMRQAPRRGATPPQDLDARKARLEYELRVAREARRRREAREQARRAAREAAAAAAGDALKDVRERFKRPSDEELGYVRTDDSFGKIFADARDELAGRWGETREELAGRLGDARGEVAGRLGDARVDVTGRLGDAREHPAAKRLADLIEDLEALLFSGTRDRRG